MAPSKDTFWTTTLQPGNPYNLSEPYPALHACVATYSLGPVVPGDAVGRTDPVLLMMSCRKDGLLLRPSVPFTSLDSSLSALAFDGFSGEVWTSFTIIGERTWYHVFGANLSAPYNIPASELEVAGNYWAYDSSPAGNFSLEPFSSSSALALPACGLLDFQLWHLAPVLASGWTLLGELGKWVPVSPQRFVQIEETESSLVLTLRGAPGEVVEISFLEPDTLSGRDLVLGLLCEFPPSGEMTMDPLNSECTSLN